MTDRDTFVSISDGDQLNDGYFNGILTSVTDTSSGHDHDGTDSKAFGWVHYETKDLTASAVTTTTFSSLTSKRMWKLVFWIYPTSGSGAEAIGIRFNADGGNNYSFNEINGTSVSNNVTQSYIRLGFVTASTKGVTGESIINNMKAISGITHTNVINQTGGSGYYPVGGEWASNADITDITVLNLSSGSFKGKLSLYYSTELEE